jgi:hypothetical protein
MPEINEDDIFLYIYMHESARWNEIKAYFGSENDGKAKSHISSSTLSKYFKSLRESGEIESYIEDGHKHWRVTKMFYDKGNRILKESGIITDWNALSNYKKKNIMIEYYHLKEEIFNKSMDDSLGFIRMSIVTYLENSESKFVYLDENNNIIDDYDKTVFIYKKVLIDTYKKIYQDTNWKLVYNDEDEKYVIIGITKNILNKMKCDFDDLIYCFLGAYKVEGIFRKKIECKIRPMLLFPDAYFRINEYMHEYFNKINSN